MIFITDQNAFYLRVTAQTKAGSQMADVDLSVIKWLVAQFVRRGRSLQSMEIDSQGRAVIFNSGDLAMGVYGVEFNGYYNGQPWRFFEKKVFAIVDQTANAVEQSGEINGIPVFDVTLTITLGGEGVPESYVTHAINEHDNDMNAHPYLHELIENAGKVDDVKVNGLSVVDENKEANINITATIDGNVGEPGVDVEQEDGEIRFAFRNMKGEKGETGAEGKQGPQGDSFQPIEDVSGLVLAHTTGQDNTKAMSQKGVTDAIISSTGLGEDYIIDLTQLNQTQGGITGEGKWNTAIYGIYIPVEAKKKYHIVAHATNFSTYCFLTSNTVGSNNTSVTTFAAGVTGLTVMTVNSEADITAPADAAYLYVSSTVTTLHDRLPQSLVELNRVPFEDILGNIDTEPIEGSGELVTSGGVYEQINESTHVIDAEEIDLSNYTAVRAFIGSNNKWVVSDDTYPYTGKFIPVEASRTYKLTGNALRYMYFALLTNNSYQQGKVASYATGKSRQDMAANEYVIVETTYDTQYLWVSEMVDYNRAPQKLELWNDYPVTEAVKAYKEMPKEIDLSEGTVIGLGPSGVDTWVDGSGDWFGKIIPIAGAKRLLVKAGEHDTYYTLLRSGWYGKNGNVAYATGYSGNGKSIKAGKTEIVDVPENAAYIYYFTSLDGNTTSCALERVVMLGDMMSRDEFDSLNLQGNSLPSFITIGEDIGVIYSAENFIFKHYEDDNVEYYAFSTDLGKNWKTVENTFGDVITRCHYFVDGTFFFCTADKCYWTTDFETFTESDIYDYDGEPFEPVEGETRFAAMKGRKRTIIDNKEWYIWGDYVLTTQKPRLWYTNDYGRTIHCAFAFGLSTIGGNVVSARHVHAFEYNPYDKKFYVFTGDAANECHIMKGTFDGTNWSWVKVATGAIWKLVYPEFFDGYFCAVTDYTDVSLADKKGLVRCPTEDITVENINYLFKAPSEMMGDAALTVYFCDKNGWRIILTDYLGGAKILIAKNNYDFVWVNNTSGYRIGGLPNPNANGDIYSSYRPVGASVATEDALNIKGPRFNFTKAMREAGATNFCDYKTTDF